MTLNQFLRKCLVRFPWLFRALNSWLPAPVLRMLRGVAEKLKFRDVGAVHDLPEICHYWSHRYVLPMLQQAGYNGFHDFFVKHIATFRDHAQIRVVSIGSTTATVRTAGVRG